MTDVKHTQVSLTFQHPASYSIICASVLKRHPQDAMTLPFFLSVHLVAISSLSPSAAPQDSVLHNLAVDLC